MDGLENKIAARLPSLVRGWSGWIASLAGTYPYVGAGVAAGLSGHERLIALVGWPVLSFLALFCGIRTYRRFRDGRDYGFEDR